MLFRSRTITINAEQWRGTQSGSGGGLLLHELMVTDGAGTRVVPLVGTPVTGSYGFRRAWLRADGTLAVEFESLAWPPRNPAQSPELVRIIDPSTGAIAEPARADPGHSSPDGRRRPRIELEESSPGRLSRIRLLVDGFPPDTDPNRSAERWTEAARQMP